MDAKIGIFSRKWQGGWKISGESKAQNRNSSILNPMSEMRSFIHSQLSGKPAHEVIDLCLDHRLIADVHPAKFGSISGLELLPNLRVFSASQHEIGSTRGIAAAPGLQEIDLNLNTLQELEELGRLEDLMALNLAHNELESEQLRHLPAGIRRLDLGFNLVSDLNALGRLIHLDSLTLNGNRHVQSLDGLPAQLLGLHIAQAFVQDFSGLAELSALRQLSLASGSRLALAPLTSHPALETLRLTPHPATTRIDLPPLPNLHSLRILKATNVQAIHGLENLPMLKHLEITQSQLGSLPDLSGNPALESIEVKFSPVTRLDGVEKLPGLKELTLKGTGVGQAEVQRIRGLRPELRIRVE
ncbi:MAG: hypothetical protein U0176_11770 [Bacteroidia bacterium]